MSGTFIDITLRDGTTIPSYVTQPAKGSGPGIVLLHDSTGLDDFVTRTADLYAEEGYVVLAPQLPPHDPKPGGIAAENFAAFVDALRALPQHAGKIGVVGFGRGGRLATRIAAQGQLGIVTSNGQICVAPAGATQPLLSNNPLAIAAPLAEPGAFLELDLATSITSRANIVAAARTVAALPAGLAQDAAGHPTRDPAQALAGSLLAFGGPKGFGLLLALEALTGVLAGGAFADQVSSKEAAPEAPEGTAPDPFEQAHNGVGPPAGQDSAPAASAQSGATAGDG